MTRADSSPGSSDRDQTGRGGVPSTAGRVPGHAASRRHRRTLRVHVRVRIARRRRLEPRTAGLAADSLEQGEGGLVEARSEVAAPHEIGQDRDLPESEPSRGESNQAAGKAEDRDDLAARAFEEVGEFLQRRVEGGVGTGLGGP